MRGLRYILVALFLLCYRGLSAQEFDLYDFRYYKRFDTVEELLAPDSDTTTTAKFTLNRDFSTHALDYNFSHIRFARRGVHRYERRTHINGIEVPYVSWSAIRALQLNERSSTDEVMLNIDTLREERTSAGFAFSSRNMPYSVLFSTAHKLKNKWSLAANLDARTGRDLHVEGLFGNSLSINLTAAKNWSNKHSFAMALFARPSMRSSRLASTAEAFRLTGNNLYNSSWGYQNGEVRNSRIRREFLPTTLASYEVAVSEKTRLNFALALTAGVERYSALDWYDAMTPAPDNYRFMPSYFSDEEDIFLEVESAWLNNDTRYTQIDFDNLVATNRLNNGEATYAISDRVQRTILATINCGATTKLEKGVLNYGIEARIANYRNYKQMRDLLGAEYSVDVDYFLLDDDTYGNSLQNNMATPNRHIVEGDRFGYDYAIRRNDISAFATYHFATNRFDLDIAAKAGYCNISRCGFYRKELFADNSLGKSKNLKFAPYALRVKAGYLVAENHYLDGYLATESKSCDDENLFLQSQYNNRTIESPTLRTSYNAELRYIFQRSNIAVSTTLFFSAMLNDTQVRHLYDDLSGEYADVVVSKINFLRYGLEVEAEYSFANHFRATVATAVGRYQYASNSLVTIYSDKSNLMLADHVASRTKGLSIGNTPQVAVTAGLSYYNKGWWATINANYAGLRYIEPSPTMRTERVLAMAVSPEELSAMTAQERLKDAFTIDISLSKSLYINRLSKKIYSTKAVPRFEDKHPRSRLIFRVGVRNLLGADNIVYNAYEASRLRQYKLAGEYIYKRHDSRYMYAYPRTFYASATFAF